MDGDVVDPHRFDFDLDRGIGLQVVEKLEASPLVKLTKSVGPDASGIYGLYLREQLVYVGKASKDRTKSKRSLRGRLNEHLRKIEGRKNIKIDEVACRYLTFASDWWVVAAEFALIDHYKPPWNYSGFGSKTPGAGRLGTGRVSKWDSDYPPA